MASPFLAEVRDTSVWVLEPACLKKSACSQLQHEPTAEKFLAQISSACTGCKAAYPTVRHCPHENLG